MQAEDKSVFNMIVPLGVDEAELRFLAESALHNIHGLTDFEIYGIFRLDKGPSITLPNGQVLHDQELYVVAYDNYTLAN